MFEKPDFDTDQNRPEKKKEVLDQGWYDRFQEIGSFQAYEYLDGDKGVREQEKKRFMDGEIENPNLDYPLLNRESLLGKEEALLNLKTDIIEREPNEVVKQAYRWRLNEKIAETRMLLASERGICARSEDIRNSSTENRMSGHSATP